jgi:hypothetical protein
MRLRDLHPDIVNWLGQLDDMKSRYVGKEGGPQWSPEGFVLKFGYAQEVDLVLPDDVEVGVLKQCYQNAWGQAMLHAGRYAYTEGFASSGILVCQHAWLTDLETGRAVDPTWRMKSHIEAAERAQADGHRIYIGVPFAKQWYTERVAAQKNYPSVIGCWEAYAAGGGDCPLIYGKDGPERFLHQLAVSRILKRAA